jgi:hypothetical protein
MKMQISLSSFIVLLSTCLRGVGLVFLKATAENGGLLCKGE